jgi:hypothetical protein
MEDLPPGSISTGAAVRDHRDLSAICKGQSRKGQAARPESAYRTPASSSSSNVRPAIEDRRTRPRCSIIFALLYATFRRWDEAALIMATLPFALTGGVWLLYLLGFNQSVATGVGFIALAGVRPSSAW